MTSVGAMDSKHMHTTSGKQSCTIAKNEENVEIAEALFLKLPFTQVGPTTTMEKLLS